MKSARMRPVDSVDDTNVAQLQRLRILSVSANGVSSLHRNGSRTSRATATATQRDQSRQQKNLASNVPPYEATARAVRGRRPICEMENRGENIGGSVSILLVDFFKERFRSSGIPVPTLAEC